MTHHWLYHTTFHDSKTSYGTDGDISGPFQLKTTMFWLLKYLFWVHSSRQALAPKCSKLGSQKAKDLVYAHLNLRFVSCRGEEYTSRPHKDWDVEAKCRDLVLSLATPDISGDASGTRSTSGVTYFVEQASCLLMKMRIVMINDM